MGHANRSHAYLSASGSKRWMNCTPSPRIESTFPEIESTYALEGTLAHEFSEIAIRLKMGELSEKAAAKETAKLRKNKHYYPGMEIDILPYVDFVVNMIDDANFTFGAESITVFLEQKVDFSKYVPEGFGTADFGIFADGCLEIVDLKFGKGVSVSAIDNSAMRLYALGLAEHVTRSLGANVEMVIMTIIQPRLDFQSTEQMKYGDLLKWAEEELRPKAASAFSGSGEANPGEWCQFCKAKGVCRAQYEYFISLPGTNWTNPDLLSDEELATIWKKSSGLSEWVNSVKDRLYKMMYSGMEVRGLKLVEGRNSREWTNPDKVKEALAKIAIDPAEYEDVSLKSPAALESTAIGRDFKNMSEFITVKKGSPSIALDTSHKATHKQKSALEDFSDEFSDEEF